MSSRTPSTTLRAIDALYKKAQGLLPANPLEAWRVAEDAQQRLHSRSQQSLIEQQKLAKVLLLLARCALAEQQFAIAVNHAEQAIALVHEDNRWEQAEGHIIAAIAGWNREGNALQALARAQESWRFIEGEEQRELHCEVICFTGLCYWYSGEYAKAQIYLEKGLALARAIGCDEWVWRSLANLGNLHSNYNHNHALALEYLLQGLAIIEQDNPENVRGRAGILMGIGVVLSNMGTYDQALEYYAHNLHLLEDAGLHGETAPVLHNIGVLHKRHGAYEKALEYLQRSIAVGGNWKAGQLLSLAGTLLELRRYDEVLELVPQCCERCDMTGDRATKSGMLHVMGCTLLALNRMDEGIQRLREGLAVSRDIQNSRHTILISADIGRALGKMGEPLQGIEQTLPALALAEEKAGKPLLLGAHSVLAELYELAGQHKLALYHYKQMHDINTAMFNEDSTQRIQALHVLHSVREAKREAELHKAQAAHLQQHIEEQKRTIAAKTMYVLQRSYALARVKKALLSVLPTMKGTAKTTMHSILAMMDEAIDNKQWQHSFEDEFQQLQHAFMAGLKQQYPQLSAIELHVCSLLKMNLSSKEICHILNIAPRSVDVYRYRIRKKLHFPSNANLSAFLLLEIAEHSHPTPS